MASAVGAAFAPGAPTTFVVADVTWRMLLAAGVTVCAAFADRWTWIVVTAVVAAGAVGGDTIVVVTGLAALAVAVIAASTKRRSSIAGAVAAALAAQVLLRLPDIGFTGASALLAALAIAPVFVSALVRVGTPVRRRVAKVAIWVGVVVVVALVPVAVGAWVGLQRSQTAVAESRAWLDAAQRADQPAVVAHLEATGEAFADVETATGGWWLWPARAIPGVGPQLRAVTEVAASGTDVAESAITAARVATVEDLRLRAGEIDVARLSALRDPLHETADELAASKQRLGALDKTWLLPPLRARVDEFEDQILETADDTALAADALDVAPALLGGEGPRTYVVLFASPAESRELGGFVGNIGVLAVDEGRIELERMERTFDFSSRTQSLPLTRLDDVAAHGFPTRYLRYTPWIFWQNITGTPDFPTVGEMVRELSPEGVGRPADGVIYIDPEGLAGLLELSGPVVIDGLDTPIDSENVAQFLLRDQYERFQDLEVREDLLERVAEVTFERVTNAELPGPRAVGDALGDRASRGHIRMWSAHPDEQAFFDRLGITGALATSPTGDDLLVTVSNANPNKADAYLRRRVVYDLDLDSATGAVSGTITVGLINDAPTSGPAYIVGNDNGDPRGSNRTFLSLYTGLEVRSATIDDAPLPLEVHEEHGLRRAAAFVTVPPKGDVRVVYDVGGTVTLDPDFTLRVRTPALAAPDRVIVRLRVDGTPVLASVDGHADLVATESDGAAATTVLDLSGVADLRFPPRA
jgi:hypothetical protein